MSERALDPEEHSARHSQSQPASVNGARFDVFLSYSSDDRSAVHAVGERLQRAGLNPWLGAWCLTPGREWQVEIADGVQASTAFAYFVGPGGEGNWARQELSLA